MSSLRVERQLLRTGEYGEPKTEAGVRSVPLPADLKEALLAYKLASRFSQDGDPRSLPAGTGKPLGHRNVTRRGFEAARDKASLPGSLSFHDLRHAAASRLIDARLTPVQVAKLLGSCGGQKRPSRAISAQETVSMSAKKPRFQGFQVVGAAGIEPATPRV